MPSSLIYTTAVSAAVATAVSSLFRWGGYWAGRIRSKFAPDHGPLSAGEWQLVATLAGTDRLRVFAACAPSRSLRSTEVDPDAAIAFVRAQFDDEFPIEPRQSLPQSGVKFEAETDTADVPYLWVWASGRVDYCTFIDLATEADGRLTLSILDVVTPIATLASAMSSTAYKRLFPRRYLDLPRRFDWFVGVGTDVRKDEQTIQWNDIAFPGEAPPRAGEQRAFCPPGGIARKALTSWNPRSPSDRLITLFLDSFLKQNGYHDCGAAIIDVNLAMHDRTRSQ